MSDKKGFGNIPNERSVQNKFHYFLEKNMSAISSTRSAVLQGQGCIPCAKVEQSVTSCFVVPFRV